MGAIAETETRGSSKISRINAFLTNAFTGSFLAVTGYAAHESEYTPHPHTPELIREFINGWGHPMFGFMTATACRLAGVQKLSKPEAAVIYTGTAAIADAGVEVGQVIYEDKPLSFIWEGTMLAENTKDLIFTIVFGVGAAVALNRRKQNLEANNSPAPFTQPSIPKTQGD